jgi:hypothetical protein
MNGRAEAIEGAAGDGRGTVPRVSGPHPSADAREPTRIRSEPQ